MRLERDLWRDLRPALEGSSSTGCTFHELNLLFQHIVQNRPVWVLELGAGISTIVLGHAAKRVKKRGSPCTIVSMEEDEYYFEDLQKLLPTSIRDSVELILSPTEDRDVDGLIARCYVAKPQRAYDMVFIDGPQVPKRREDPRFFDGDVLDVLAWNDGIVTAFLDGRAGTRENLMRLFPWARMDVDHDHRFTRFIFPAKASRV